MFVCFCNLLLYFCLYVNHVYSFLLMLYHVPYFQLLSISSYLSYLSVYHVFSFEPLFTHLFILFICHVNVLYLYLYHMFFMCFMLFCLVFNKESVLCLQAVVRCCQLIWLGDSLIPYLTWNPNPLERWTGPHWPALPHVYIYGKIRLWVMEHKRNGRTDRPTYVFPV